VHIGRDEVSARTEMLHLSGTGGSRAMRTRALGLIRPDAKPEGFQRAGQNPSTSKSAHPRWSQSAKGEE
jgi:hypothetical protein